MSPGLQKIYFITMVSLLQKGDFRGSIFAAFSNQMHQPKLFMLLLGCKPLGRNTKQHDIFFGIANSLPKLKSEILNFWPEGQGKIHIDAWREVNVVNIDDKYGIDLDDLYDVEEILPAASKTNYQLEIVPNHTVIEDIINIGYLKLSRL
jgi:hypothetical protein